MISNTIFKTQYNTSRLAHQYVHDILFVFVVWFSKRGLPVVASGYREVCQSIYNEILMKLKQPPNFDRVPSFDLIFIHSDSLLL